MIPCIVRRMPLVSSVLLAVGLFAFSAPVQAADNHVDVYITDAGVQPAEIFVAAGGAVVWHNQTAQPVRLSDQPFAAEELTRLYVPRIMTPGDSHAAAESAADVQPAAWVSDPIAPGSTLARTYAAAGDFAFYVSVQPGFTGSISVLPDSAVGSRLIDAEQGGQVEAGTSTLTIPPGALAADTAITLVRPQGVTLDGEGIEYVQVEPDGLSFAAPVTLTLSYTASPELDEDFINFALYSEDTGEWETLPIVAQDQAANQVTVTISHFSWGIFYTDEPLYVVLELPGKYLRPGDILTRMDPECGDRKADWFPAHTAIYSATVGTGSNGQQIIESNPNGWTSHVCTSAGGVRSSTWGALVHDPNHTCGFYMGARRPAGVSAGAQQHARDFAAQQLGKGYLAIGQGDWLTNGNCYSCVGLVEDAYEKAGLNDGEGIVPWSLGKPGITPLDQFKRTVPVSEITIQVGEEIRIPVYAILKHDSVFGGDYYARAIFYPTISAAPAGSSYQGGVFTWTPARADGGKSFTVSFAAEHTTRKGTYPQQQTLTIHVAAPPNQAPTQPHSPVPANQTANQPTDITLDWQGGDPDGDAVTYEVYFGTTNLPSKVASGHAATTFDPGSLAPATTYYWQVLASDSWGATAASPVWRFTTAAQTPISDAAIALGYSHTCALTSNKGVKCWGQNSGGQLGDGTTIDRSRPVDVLGLQNIRSISAGSGHTCALTNSGGVKCWGSNYYGELGDGTTTNRLTPMDVSGLQSGVIAIDAGWYHTCALTSSGEVKCWGDNSSGQVGDNSVENRMTPVDVEGLSSGVVAVSAGNHHTCALTAAGGVKCWGTGFYGELGDGTWERRLVPVDVTGLQSGVIAISAGNYHTCALISSGVKCWGDNSAGQIGDGGGGVPCIMEDDEQYRCQLTPVDVAGLASSVSTISAGSSHTCALTNGGVKCWGANSSGQVGDGTTTKRATPMDVVGLQSGVAAIAAGTWEHTCAITSGGGIKCWGSNFFGELGEASTAPYSPVPLDMVWP